MAKVDLHETSEPAFEKPAMVSQTAGSLLMSIGFWLSLLMAACLYAAVALTPKLAGWINARQQYLENSARLSQLEDEVDYLERVAAALKNDPEFARRLVRANQNSGLEQTEFLPVSRDLLFGGSPQAEPTVPQVVQPAVARVIFHLASDQTHRNWLLIAAAGITISAFTLLNEAGVGIVRVAISGILGLLSAATARYRKPTEDAESDLS